MKAGVVAALLFALLLPVGVSGKTSAAKGPPHLSLVRPGVLSVGSDTTYPPMEAAVLNRPGAFYGADIDLAGALARAMGLGGAHIVVTTFDSIIPALQRRNFDVIMSSMNDTPTRRKQIDFIDYMRLRASESILVPKSSSIHANDYSGLCGHSVSVETGTAELDDLKAANKNCSSKITIKGYPKDTDAFQALVSGHADAYTTDLPVGLFYLKKYPSLRFAGKAFGSGAFYGIGVLKSAKALNSALRQALTKIHRSGQYLRILQRWGLGSTACCG
jgi:polar amino acid transport system substrate-binding protein